MTIFGTIILFLWLVLWVYWAISAGRAKRSIGGGWAQWAWVRFGVIVLFFLALRTPATRQALRQAHLYTVHAGVLLGLCGVVICALGIGLAIWARVYLGRNWGMPMSLKENPELVTTGPYAYIRHPIYAGILLAMLGSTIDVSIAWLIPLVIFGASFIYSARREEKIMLDQFPNEYSAYMKRTKMLVPFVL